MRHAHHPRPATKRPPAQKQREEDRVDQQEIEKWTRYIENVRRTGIHWRHHVERLESKYPNNLHSVYTELTENVKDHKAKKAAKKAKAEAKRLKSKPPSPPTTSNDGSTSSVSSGSETSTKSGQTFLSTGVTQAMLEQSRGRPRKKSRIPSKLSHKLPISASQPVSHQASQATHFSLSDEAPTPVDEISHGATFDDVDPASCADFFTPAYTPKPHERKRQTTVFSSDSESPPKRAKKSLSRNATTESVLISSQPVGKVNRTKSVNRNTSDKHGNAEVYKEVACIVSEPMNKVSTQEHLSSSQTKISNIKVGNDSQIIPSSSQMSIAAAIDELMNEDGTARDFISLEEPRLSVSVGSRTCHPQKAAPQETYQPALPRQLDRHLSTAEAYDALRPIVGPVTRPIKAPSLFECAAPSMPSTSQSALLRTFEAVTPSEGNGKLPAAQMQNSSVDPDIAALISKPDGVASFLNDLEVSLQSGRAVNEGHGANGRPSDPSTHTQIPFAATPTIPSSEPSQSNLAVPSDALAYPVISEPSGILAILAKADSRLRGDAGGSFSSIDGDPIKAFGDLGQSVAIAESRPLRFSSSVPHSPAMDVQQSGRPDAASPAGIFADVSRVALHPVGLHTQPTSVPPLNIPKVLPFADVAIATLKINPVFIKILSDNAFINISDLAEANMNRDDIRLLAASIQEEQKVSKSETIVAILRLDAALQQYKQK